MQPGLPSAGEHRGVQRRAGAHRGGQGRTEEGRGAQRRAGEHRGGQGCTEEVNGAQRGVGVHREEQGCTEEGRVHREEPGCTEVLSGTQREGQDAQREGARGPADGQAVHRARKEDERTTPQALLGMFHTGTLTVGGNKGVSCG